MIFKNGFLKFGSMILPLVGCAFFSSNSFAQDRFDRAIDYLNQEEANKPVKGRNYGVLREYIKSRQKIDKLNKRQKELLSELSDDEKANLSTDFAGLCNGFDDFSLVPYNFGFNLFNGFDDCFKSMNGYLENSLDRMGNFLKGFGSNLSNLAGNSEPEALINFRNSENCGVLVFDNNDAVKYKVKLDPVDDVQILKNLKTDWKNEGPEFAVSNLLKRYYPSSDLDELKKDGFTVFVKPQPNEFFSVRKSKNGSTSFASGGFSTASFWNGKQNNKKLKSKKDA